MRFAHMSLTSPALHAVPARPGSGRQPHECRTIDAWADRRRSDFSSGDIASFTVEANDAAASIFRLTLPLIRH
ncbi:hypothetical protein TP50_18175 [Xanthomonas citri pv. aurantifolii]|nr:hypothetical protein TP50_18175 [Xanthomonas citri pv. aurantifolii]